MGLPVSLDKKISFNILYYHKLVHVNTVVDVDDNVLCFFQSFLDNSTFSQWLTNMWFVESNFDLCSVNRLMSDSDVILVWFIGTCCQIETTET